MHLAYQKITDRIIDCLSKGTVPWHQPWAGGQPARNYITKHQYSGINRITTNMLGYNSPYFLTYGQLKSLKGFVKKGEHGTPILFFNIKRKEEADDSTDKKVIINYFNVFNLEQTSLPDERNTTKVIDFNPIDKAEQIIASYQRPPQIVHERQQAFYQPTNDTINMPAKNSFISPAHYYGTIFHELSHSTGSHSRLNRIGITDPIKFGSHGYSFEELIAEIGSSFLMNTAGLDLVEQNAAYIASWLKVLKSEPKMVVMAAAEAQKAVNHILGIAPQLQDVNIDVEIA